MIPRHKYDICTLLLKGGNRRCYNKEACEKRCKQQNIKSIASSPSSFLVDTSDDDRRVEEKKIWDDRKARSAEEKKIKRVEEKKTKRAEEQKIRDDKRVEEKKTKDGKRAEEDPSHNLSVTQNILSIFVRRTLLWH